MKEREKILNVPNVLTMIRALLIPVYWVLFMDGRHYIALAVFIIASLTDLLDGYIARKYHLITNFGKLMDPLADKLMVLSVMLSLVIKEFVCWPPLAIILIKEGLMVLGGAVMLKKGIVVYAEKIGKYAQATTVLALVLSFFSKDAWFVSMGFPLHEVILWIAVVLTLCALCFYGRNAIRKLKAIQ